MTPDLSMTPAARLHCALELLDFRADEFFLGGSAQLALRGIRHAGDLDVGVTTRYWFELASRPEWEVWTPNPLDCYVRCDPPYLIRQVGDLPVHVFFSWRYRGPQETPYNDYNLVFEDGLEVVAGWPCIKLEILLRMKVDALAWERPHRPKDVTDVRHIVNSMILREGE